MIEIVNADRRGNDIFVTSFSETIDGLYVITDWWRQLSNDTSDEELGKTVLLGLAQTELGLPRPGRDKLDARLRQLHQAAGVRSYSAYMKGTQSTGIKREDDQIQFMPCRNNGAKGFTPIPDKAILLPADASAGQIGAAVRQTWGLNA